VKPLRFILITLTLSVVATAAVAARAAATPSQSACGPWDHCLCIEVGCYLGDQLCASGPGFACYQF
jgi:hypothetical protein